jgi:DNA-binding GntR family transcriptional regulator
VLSELEVIRQEHRSGTLVSSRTALATTISEQLRLRGLSEVGKQGVEAWLRSG